MGTHTCRKKPEHTLCCKQSYSVRSPSSRDGPESHRVRPFDFLFCLEGAHQRVSAGERESRGLFSGKIFALVFKRGSLVTGAETSAVYKLWVYHAQK